MARLTRQEKTAGACGGLLLGCVVALIGQVTGYGLAVEIPLSVIFAVGLSAFLVGGKHGIR